MLEDDSYRQSSQYRLWSFTAGQLSERRTESNHFASEKVRAAFTRAHLAASKSNEDGDPTTDSAPQDTTRIETLTVAEEQLIVQWGCEKILEMQSAIEPRPPSTIIATAIQYLRRFYLYNSPMTYHPKQITVCALFLAMKSGHFAISLSRLTRQIGNVSEADVRAPEFLMMQALRFTLDVRHPIRSLEGNIADIRLHSPDLDCFIKTAHNQIKKRIDTAGDAARQLLVKDVQLTDAYFLYTPPQISLASLLIVDKVLTLAYINHLFSSPRLDASITVIKQKLIDTITSCATLIQSHKPTSEEKSMARIGKKLRKCQDPEKTNLVAVVAAKAAEKREGNSSDEERKAKKRRLQREKKEADAGVFGGELQVSKEEDD